MAIQTFPSLRGAAYPVGKEIVTQSLINTAVSGKRTVVAEWTHPIYRITMPFEYLGSNPSGSQNQDWQTFTGFFKQVMGPVFPFHWNDPDDNSATTQALLNSVSGTTTGDGTTKIFLFQRTLGGATEPVQDVTTVTQITVAGTATTAYTLLVDPNWGFTYGLTFTTAPASGAAVAGTFTYNWPCEFEKDSLAMTSFASRFWELKEVRFLTKKVN